MKNVKPSHIRVLTLILAIIGLTVLARINQPKAANLQEVSVTMSNSRFSMRGRVDGTPGSDTIIDVEIDPAIDNYTTNSDTEVTDLLVVGDTITFTGTTDGDRTVQEIVGDDTIAISSAIATTDEPFYLASASSLEVEFETNTVVTTGYFQVLVPAHPTETNNNGIPDQGYFDFGSSAPTVTCTPSGGASHTPGTTTSQANQSGGILPSGTWHVYTCPYTTGGTNGTITIDISNIINPVPTDDHVTGVAETYEVIVRNVRSSDDAVIDSTSTRIGAIEAVRVSATVVPSLTFTISGQAAAANRCGVNTDVATTASSVPFGEIGPGLFRNAAQELEFATNALDGAVVTALANDQLGREGQTCTGKLNPTYTLDPASDHHLCIWDANVDGMSHTAQASWNDFTETGFAYSIQNINSDSPAFVHGTDGPFAARHFADAEFNQDPVTIFSNSLPTNSDSIYVCYRIVPDALTAAGNYYNYITYTATATF